MKTPILKLPDRFANADYEKDVPDFIKKYVENFTETRKGLYIYGGAGTGKTHLAYAICRYLRDKDKGVVAFGAMNILKMIKEDIFR